MLTHLRILGASTAFLVLLIDQLTKYIAAASLYVGQKVEILPFFNLVLTYNHGVSFGFFQSQQLYQKLFLVSLVVCIILWLIVCFFRTGYGIEIISYGLIIGGALSNTLDRFTYGGVVDFLEFYYEHFYWPAFNVADAAIVIAVALILLHHTWHGKGNLKK